MNEPTVESIVGRALQELVGCSWGRSIWTNEDPALCHERSVQLMVLHDGHYEYGVKLCAKHRDAVLAETTPHRDA